MITNPKFSGTFNRVMITLDGDAVSLDRALAMKILPVIAFLRNDGWSLGATLETEGVAYKAWADKWTHFFVGGDSHWRPISEYQEWKNG